MNKVIIVTNTTITFIKETIGHVIHISDRVVRLKVKFPFHHDGVLKYEQQFVDKKGKEKEVVCGSLFGDKDEKYIGGDYPTDGHVCITRKRNGSIIVELPYGLKHNFDINYRDGVESNFQDENEYPNISYWRSGPPLRR